VTQGGQVCQPDTAILWKIMAFPAADDNVMAAGNEPDR